MSGSRPNSETARRMGVVPFSGSSHGNANNGGSVKYPNVSSNKSAGDFAGNKASAPQAGNDQLWSNGSGAYNQNSAPAAGTKGSAQGGNDQLWSNGSGAYNQNSAPAGPNNMQGAPMNRGYSSDNRQASAPGGPGPVGGGYNQQGTQPANGPGAPHQQQQQPNGQQQQQQLNWQQQQQQQSNRQQQQQPNAQGYNVQQPTPVPANSGNKVQNKQGGGGYVEGIPAGTGPQQRPNWQGSQGGSLTQGDSREGPMPKGDYVHYDGNGNQVQPEGGPNGSGHWTGSGNERHFHHHYYHGQSQPQPQPAVGYPYDKKMEQKKKRKPGATALAAALITCWACTCCCHAPCGF